MACLQKAPATYQPPEQVLRCGNCEVSVNKHSRITQEGGKHVWTCEFCNFCNNNLPGNFSIDHLPREEEVTYCLTPPEVQKEESKGEETSKPIAEEGSIIFCLDISGSMSARNKLGTVVGVLQRKLADLEKNNPEKKVGLVTFGVDVAVCLGSAQQAKQVLERIDVEQEVKEPQEQNQSLFGKLANAFSKKEPQFQTEAPPKKKMAMKKKAPPMQQMVNATPAPLQSSNFNVCPKQCLNIYDECLNWAQSFKNRMQPIATSNATIKQELNQVATQGATALGPGALVAVGLAIGNEPQGS